VSSRLLHLGAVGALRVLGVAEAEQEIQEHIQVLSDFERLYGEFVRLLAEDRRSDFGPRHGARLEQMQREILEATPRADIAARASGHWLTTTNPPMMGGGVRAESLAGQVLDIEEPGFSDDGLRIPRMILQTVPVQIGALRLKLSKAEERGQTRAERRAARRTGEEPPSPAATAPPARKRRPPSEAAPESMRPWHENPWVLGIGVTMIGGLGVVGVIALIGLLG
jgi:hypothetical protein